MNLAAYDKIGSPPAKSKLYMSNTYPYIIIVLMVIIGIISIF